MKIVDEGAGAAVRSEQEQPQQRSTKSPSDGQSLREC